MFSINVPNLLTLLRILFVPVVVAGLLDRSPSGDVLAAIVFAAASLTDFVDGWWARSRNAVTTFGKLMDPVADKLLVVAALVSLVSLHRLAAWVAMVIIARELTVTMVRVAATGQGLVISAKRWGKVKTLLQVLAIFLLITVHPTPAWLDGFVYFTVAVTLLSGVDFFFGLRRSVLLARSGPRAAAGAAPERPAG